MIEKKEVKKFDTFETAESEEGLFTFEFAKTAEANDRLYAAAARDKKTGKIEIFNGGSRDEVVTSKTSGAKKAVLDYEVIHQISDERTESGKRILIKIHLETGRHHQIRVQMAHAGMPLLGDRKYNPGEISQLPLGLCSCHLIFRHPITGKKMEFQVTPNGESFAGFPNP